MGTASVGLMWVSTHGRNLFPSVLLQPLGHLSTLESRAYEQFSKDYRTRRRSSRCSDGVTYGDLVKAAADPLTAAV